LTSLLYRRSGYSKSRLAILSDGIWLAKLPLYMRIHYFLSTFILLLY